MKFYACQRLPCTLMLYLTCSDIYQHIVMFLTVLVLFFVPLNIIFPFSYHILVTDLSTSFQSQIRNLLSIFSPMGVDQKCHNVLIWYMSNSNKNIEFVLVKGCMQDCEISSTQSKVSDFEPQCRITFDKEHISPCVQVNL